MTYQFTSRYLGKRSSPDVSCRCNRLRCPLARLSGLQCFNMGHNDHGINLYGVIMILMGNVHVDGPSNLVTPVQLCLHRTSDHWHMVQTHSGACFVTNFTSLSRALGWLRRPKTTSLHIMYDLKHQHQLLLLVGNGTAATTLCVIYIVTRGPPC